MVINLLGLALIVFIVWWFWLYKPEKTKVTDDDITITVENGVYVPANITLPADKAITLTFIRKDASPCASTVIFDGLNISQELPLNKVIQVNLPALKKGEYAFTCQMHMYKGSISAQ